MGYPGSEEHMQLSRCRGQDGVELVQEPALHRQSCGSCMSFACWGSTLTIGLWSLWNMNLFSSVININRNHTAALRLETALQMKTTMGRSFPETQDTQTGALVLSYIRVKVWASNELLCASIFSCTKENDNNNTFPGWTCDYITRQYIYVLRSMSGPQKAMDDSYCFSSAN